LGHAWGAFQSCGPLRHEFAVVEDRDAVADAFHHVHHVRAVENRLAGRGERADQLLHRQRIGARIEPEHARLTLEARQKAAQDLDRRRFPRAVRPDVAEDRPGLDREVDSVEHGARAIPLAHAAQLDRRLRHRRGG
jgi:hypothetical protein